jgi:hypothetical protein
MGETGAKVRGVSIALSIAFSIAVQFIKPSLNPEMQRSLCNIFPVFSLFFSQRQLNLERILRCSPLQFSRP